jgi:hypothetical protein
MNWIIHPLELHHLRVLSGVSKTIFEPTVCLAQTMQLSCTDTNTISKWTKTRFDMTHVTLEFHRVRPRQFLMLWYVWHKPCTYLALRLALSSNGLNRASTWDSSPRSIIRCIQNDFSACGTFDAKPCTYLASRLALYQMNWVKHLLELRYLGVVLGASKTISEPTVCLAETMHLSCTDTNTISK